MTIEQWFICGEVGVSSKTLASGLVGIKLEGWQADIPFDVHDFRRCVLFETLCQEWDARGGWPRIVNLYPWLAPYARDWESLNHLFCQKQSDELRTRLELLRVESLRIRYPKATIETNENGYLRYMNTNEND